MIYLRQIKEEEHERLWTEKTPILYYLAQVALEVRRVLHKKPKKIKLKDFLIPFKFKGQKVTGRQKKRTREVESKQLQNSKLFWLGHVFSAAKKKK